MEGLIRSCSDRYFFLLYNQQGKNGHQLSISKEKEKEKEASSRSTPVEFRIIHSIWILDTYGLEVEESRKKCLRRHRNSDDWFGSPNYKRLVLVLDFPHYECSNESFLVGW